MRQRELGGGAVDALQHGDGGGGEGDRAVVQTSAEDEEDVERVVKRLLPGGTLLLAQTVHQDGGKERERGEEEECLVEQRRRTMVESGVHHELQRVGQRGHVKRVHVPQKTACLIRLVVREAGQQRRGENGSDLERRLAVVRVVEEGVVEGEAAPRVGEHAEGNEGELVLLRADPALKHLGTRFERRDPRLRLSGGASADVVAVLAEEDER